MIIIVFCKTGAIEIIHDEPKFWHLNHSWEPSFMHDTFSVIAYRLHIIYVREDNDSNV